MTYVETVLADSPLFYYRFNELSGTNSADSSGNGNDGTYNPIVQDGITLGVTGATDINDGGKAITLIDPAAYVDSGVNAAANPGTGDFSVECWIKKAVPPVISYCIGKAPVGIGDKFGIAIDNFGFVNITLNGTTIGGTGNQATSVYKHIVVVRQSGEITLYVNGVVNKTATFASAINPDANVLIGRLNLNDSLLTGFGPGTVDEAAWYTTALSQARVLAHFQAATAAPPSPASADNGIPIACWWPSH